MQTLIIDNLSKRYGTIRALNNVSLAVDNGEVFGYLGPNGAGKTTTLRIILGLVHATSGGVQLLDRTPSVAAIRENVGYLPGELRLYGNMTGKALLDHFAGFRPHRPPLLRNHLVDVLAIGSSVLHQRIKFLSHGTRQKLGLVIAMQHDPTLVLLDEPTTGLDPLVQKSFKEVVKDFARRGNSVFFSSHVLSEVEDVCSRVAILRSGEIVAIESIENLRSRMVRRLQVRFRDFVPNDLLDTSGVTDSEISGKEVWLTIRGDVNPILRRLARADIENFVFPEPELEDIFLKYYQSTT